MVDFDSVCQSDPLHWIGLTGAAIVCDLGAEQLRYVDALLHHWGATPEERARTSLYAAVFALEFLQRLAVGEPPTRAPTAVRRWAKDAVDV